jgi:hypothetical protein
VGCSFINSFQGRICRHYYKNFKSNRSAPTKDARLVLGVIIIKHIMKTVERGVIEMIQENPCMQYFLGLCDNEVNSIYTTNSDLSK